MENAGAEFMFVQADRAALVIGLFVDDHAITASALPLLGYRHYFNGRVVPVFDHDGRPMTQPEIETDMCGRHAVRGCRKLVALYDVTSRVEADAAWHTVSLVLDSMIN